MSQRYIGGLETLNPTPLNPALGNAANGIFSMSQYFSLKNQGLWPAIDPYFRNTTLLLHGNGTNGAQNNTFLDSSTNNFTITRNGNTTQGTFTPYGSNWSNYFDGSGDSLTAPSGACISGTGDFTAECWIFPTTVPGSYNVIGCSDSSNGLTMFGLNANGTIFYGRSLVNVEGTTTNTCTYNTWNHIAISRSSGTIKMFVNGVQGYSATSTYSYVSGTVRIGTDGGGSALPYTGYISNFRIIQGSALYTSNFTPSTGPLTAITNTSLLICQSNRFVDNSSNAFTITCNGDTSVQRFSPFNPSAPYAAGTIGGSGYFDGSGDYLNAGNQTALHLEAGDFTVEMWLWKNANTAYMTACGDFTLASTNTFQILADVGGTKIGWYNGASNAFTITSSAAILINTWTHIAFVRSGSILTLYINGVSDSTATLTTNYNATTSFYIGHTPELSSGRYWNGYISNLRIVKGTAVYTTTFTPPTTPLTAITNTSLLLNFTNGGIIDNAMMNDLETVGNAQISTTQSKFGGASLYFDGTGDYLVAPSNSIFSFGTGDFTIECWYYSGATGQQTVFDTRNTSSGPGVLVYTLSNKLRVYSNGVDYIGTANVASNTWVHLVVERRSSALYTYVNGTVDINGTSYTPNLTDSSCIVGYDIRYGGFYLNGYIDDLRITKGIARYTANFTPQTSQWQDQ